MTIDVVSVFLRIASLAPKTTILTSHYVRRGEGEFSLHSVCSRLA